MNDDEQRLESADTVQKAINSCRAVLQVEQNKQHKGKWDHYFNELRDLMSDYGSNIDVFLREGLKDTSGPEYEKQTGHDHGTNPGCV